ncbi:MAG: phosphoribosylamine--glycine ligase [Firmicutes bacterium]|nr:phosphoribosylamine--glycine ligase [Bacillota bacterium]
MRIMVIGGGGREHALVWSLSRSPQVDAIHCVPGNAGIAALAECHAMDPEDLPALAGLAHNRGIDLTVVGPEAPLVAGIVDHFMDRGLTVMGPERKASLLEGSKSWAKEFMAECGIPTADFEVFESFDRARKFARESRSRVVVKADGLAAGKGVFVTDGPDEAESALRQIMLDRIFGDAGNKVIIEERLEGEEATLLALTDGKSFLTMPSSQDHKAVGEGDTGPNTGGMGAYAPAPVMTGEMVSSVEENVFQPLLEGMRKRGLLYRGVIYAGLMVTAEGPRILEFNVRFGDPEAQAILPLLDDDLASVLFTAAGGNLVADWKWRNEVAVCVVMASGGYPGAYQQGKIISGLEESVSDPHAVVFHAGTVAKAGKILTAGGRVLGITSWSRDLQSAVDRAYSIVEKIKFEGAYYRRDIAHRALK